MVKHKKDEKRSRKAVFGFVALFAAVAVIVGVGYAYFSDVITGSGQATAGTLDISGTPTLTQNGTAVASPIANLNPGDVIGINGSSIVNNGSKSAWIRAILTNVVASTTDNTAAGVAATSMVGNLNDYLWICTGGESQATLIAASNAAGGFAANAPADCTAVAGSTATTIFGAKTTYTLADVIPGSVENDGTWTAATATFPEIYFDAAAGNVAQNGNVTFDIKVQALQYRNNTTSPTETQWSTVTTTPFAL